AARDRLRGRECQQPRPGGERVPGPAECALGARHLLDRQEGRHVAGSLPLQPHQGRQARRLQGPDRLALRPPGRSRYVSPARQNRRRGAGLAAVTVAALILGLALSGCGGGSARVAGISGDRLMIYASLPEDGPWSADATAVMRGADLALADVHARIG